MRGRYYPELVAAREAAGRPRFLLATDAEALTQVLGVVYRTGFSLHAEIGVEADQREKDLPAM